MHAQEQRCALKEGCPPMAGILLAGGMVLAAVVVQSAAGLAEVLQWERGAEVGVSWLTAHLCHWSWNHLVWDVVVFAVLSLLSLRMMPTRYAWCVLVAAMAIVLEIQWNQSELDFYRGLSGIDCALSGLVVAGLWQSGEAPGGRWLAVMASGAFVAKSVYEMVTGGTLFVEESQSARFFIPVVSAHLTGFACGVVVGLWRQSREASWSAVAEPAKRVTTPLSQALPPS